MTQIQQKQKYLRQNIQIDQYEDFADFFQNQTGQIDISQLSIDYLKQIVNKYKSLKIKQEEEQKHQKSFANYQTADLNNAYNIVGGMKTNTNLNQNNNNMMNTYTSNNYNNNNNNNNSNNNNNNNNNYYTNNQNPINLPLQQQKSATDLLDSVFQQSSSSQCLSSSPPSNINQNYKSNSPPANEKNYRSSTNMSFFENNNIWATTSNIQNNNGQRKSIQFDNFWQLPGNSNQFKTDAGYNQNNNSFNLNKDKQKVPSFEELTKNLNLNNTNNNTINMQKKSNPYIVDNQKPSNMKKQQQMNKYSSNPNQMNKKVQQDKKQLINTNNYTSNKPIESSSSLSSSNQIKLISTKPISSKPGSIASSYKMNKIPYQGPVIHKNSFTDTIKCYQAMPRPQLNDKPLIVTIQKHQIVQRNFFVSDYVMYFLTIKPLNIICKRNYEDFTKLRAALQKVYPGVQLPYLQKNSWFQTNLQNIKKQKAMLQFFLHDLIQNPQIRNSRMFEDFLTLKQHKQIKRKFQQYAKMDQFKSIQQLCVLGGKVDIVINQNQRIHHEQLSKYLDIMEDYLNKKNKLMDTLGEQFTAVNNTLINLSKLSQSMSEQVKKFNQKVNENEIPGLQNTFNLVSKSLQQWASRINFQSKVVTKRLAPFYKYQKDNISTMRQLLTTQSILQKSYLRRISQSSTSSQDFTSQKLKPFKTTILQQSKNFTILKYQLGYISNMTCKQSVRFFESMSNSFKEKYVYMAEKYKERLAKDIGFFNNIINGGWV